MEGQDEHSFAHLSRAPTRRLKVLSSLFFFERRGEIFHLLFYSADACNSWLGLAEAKSQEFHEGSLQGDGGPSSWTIKQLLPSA